MNNLSSISRKAFSLSSILSTSFQSIVALKDFFGISFNSLTPILENVLFCDSRFEACV